MIQIRRTDTYYLMPMMNDSRAKKRDWMIVFELLLVEIFDGVVVTIPVGYATDFHSVWRILQSFFRAFDNRTNLAALVHDYLYEHWEEFVKNGWIGARNWTDKYWSSAAARHYVDFAYLELMNRFSPDTPIENYVRYLWVRSLGWFNWYRERRKYKKIG